MGWLDLSKPHTIEMNYAFSPSAIQRCHFVRLHSYNLTLYSLLFMLLTEGVHSFDCSCQS